MQFRWNLVKPSRSLYESGEFGVQELEAYQSSYEDLPVHALNSKRPSTIRNFLD